VTAGDRIVERTPDEFRASYRVRFDEASPDGLARTSSLLRYAQDLASAHSEARGFDRAWYRERGLAWLVRAAIVEIRAPIGFGSTLEGTTRAVAFRRVWARRRSEFRLVDGSIAAVVEIDWLLVGGRGTPARIPADFDEVFRPPPSPASLARVEPGAIPADASRFDVTVRPQELDPMEHVNNAVYADWLDEAISSAAGDRRPDPTRTVPRVVRIEYAGSAGRGARLSSAVWSDGSAWWYRLLGPDGTDLVRARVGS
jgi:acyl-ACP thioesterase